MGRIGDFFGRPGERPALHHRAPLIQHDPATINQLSLSTDKINNNTTSQETLNDVKLSHDIINDKDKGTCGTDSDEWSLSDSDDASTKVDLTNVHLQNDGYISINTSFTGQRKAFTDKALDRLVIWAGTQPMFFLMWIILIIWVVIGGVYNAPYVWQVVMQDGQSIQCYFWDTLLTRQQLTSSHEQVLMTTQLRSRLQTFKRLLLRDNNKSPRVENKPPDHYENISGELPVENWYDRCCTAFSWIIGSVPCMVLFWCGIFVWIGCGAVPQGGETFSDGWQMDINTATAVCLLISSFFLQNIRARHDLFISKFLIKIVDMDDKIDLILRSVNDDFQTPNPVVTVDPAPRTKPEHIIDWYADVVGTGIGVVVAICVFAVWAGIGKPLHWSDDWWLIIGTYTGLVGFLDGFVIRQVYFRIINHEEDNFHKLASEEKQLFQILALDLPEEYFNEPVRERTLNYKISEFVNMCCSTQWSVLASIIIIIALICIASGMLWSTTGQLIANTPTMIIEEFFMIVLIQAHNWADEKRRFEISALYARRHTLLKYVQAKYI